MDSDLIGEVNSTDAIKNVTIPDCCGFCRQTNPKPSMNCLERNIYFKDLENLKAPIFIKQSTNPIHVANKQSEQDIPQLFSISHLINKPYFKGCSTPQWSLDEYRNWVNSSVTNETILNKHSSENKFGSDEKMSSSFSDRYNKFATENPALKINESIQNDSNLPTHSLASVFNLQGKIDDGIIGDSYYKSTSANLSPNEQTNLRKIRIFTNKAIKISKGKEDYVASVSQNYSKFFGHYLLTKSNHILTSNDREDIFGTIPGQAIKLGPHFDINIQSAWKSAVLPKGTFLGEMEILVDKHWEVNGLPDNSFMKMKNVEFSFNEEWSDQDILDEIEKLCLQHEWLRDFNFGKTAPIRLKLHTLRLMLRYVAAFCIDKNDIGKSKNTKFNIYVTDETPINIKPYKMNPESLKALQEIIETYRKMDIIEYSDSQWAAPALLVKKPDGTFRCVLDYRRLNKVTIPSVWPLESIDYYLDVASKGKKFCKFDISQAFLQMEIPEEMRKYTAFKIGNSLYQFKRCAFGLRNSGFDFSRSLFHLFKDQDPSKICHFVDDILLIGGSNHDCLEQMEIVLQKLIEEGYKLRPSKSNFFYDEISFLGFKISADGVKPDSAKLAPLFKAKKPQNVKAIRSLLGSIQYWNRFLPEIQAIASPLTDLTKLNAKWEWGPEHDFAHMAVLKRLALTPILAAFTIGRKTFLTCDSSLLGGSSCLGQFDKNGDPHLIAFFSKKWSSAQRSYSIYDLEMLIVILSLKHFRQYLLCTPETIVFSDNTSVCSLLSQSSPTAKGMRYINIISEFNISFTHIPTKSNYTDYLSRAFEHKKIKFPVRPQKSCNFPIVDVSEHVLNSWKSNLIIKLKLDELPKMPSPTAIDLPKINKSGKVINQTLKKAPNSTVKKLIKIQKNIFVKAGQFLSRTHINPQDTVMHTDNTLIKESTLTKSNMFDNEQGYLFPETTHQDKDIETLSSTINNIQSYFQMSQDLFQSNLCDDTNNPSELETVLTKETHSYLNKSPELSNKLDTLPLVVPEGEEVNSLSQTSQTCVDNEHLHYVSLNSLYVQCSLVLCGSDKYAFQLRNLVTATIKANPDLFNIEEDVSLAGLLSDIKNVTANFKSEIVTISTLFLIPIQLISLDDSTLYYPLTVLRYSELAPYGALIILKEDPILGFIWTNKSLTREVTTSESLNINFVPPEISMDQVKNLIESKVPYEDDDETPGSDPTTNLDPLAREALQEALDSPLIPVENSTYPNKKQRKKKSSSLPSEDKPTISLLDPSDILPDEGDSFKYFASRKKSSKKTMTQNFKRRISPRTTSDYESLPPPMKKRRPRDLIIDLPLPQKIELNRQVLLQYQNSDPLCSIFKSLLLNKDIQFSVQEKHLRELKHYLSVLIIDEEGILLNNELLPHSQFLHNTTPQPRVVLPLQLITSAIIEIHNASHFSLLKSLKLLNSRFWRPRCLNVPSLSQIARHYLRTCLLCPLKKSHHKSSAPGPLLSTHIPHAPRISFAVDYLGGLPASPEMRSAPRGKLRQDVPTGRVFRHVFVCIDLLSSFVHLFPTEVEDAVTALNCIIQVCSTQGRPTSIKSDNASYFESSIWTHGLKRLGIIPSPVLPYSPWSNSQVERTNLILCDTLRTLKPHPTEWHTLLPFIMMQINNAYCPHLGDTPAFCHTGSDFRVAADLLIANPVLKNKYLLYGDSPHTIGVRLQNDLITVNKLLPYNVRSAREKHAGPINLRRRLRSIEAGDLILIKLPFLDKDALNKKIRSEFVGPFRVFKMERGYKVVVKQAGGDEYYSTHLNLCKKIPDTFQEAYLHWIDAQNESLQLPLKLKPDEHILPDPIPEFLPDVEEEVEASLANIELLNRHSSYIKPANIDWHLFGFRKQNLTTVSEENASNV